MSCKLFFFLSGFHSLEKEKFTAFIPALLPSWRNGFCNLYRVKMVARRSSNHAGNHQWLCAHNHVFVLLPNRLQARAEAVPVVEEAHNSGATCTVFLFVRSFSSSSFGGKLRVSSALFVDSSHARHFLSGSFRRFLYQSVHQKETEFCHELILGLNKFNCWE